MKKILKVLTMGLFMLSLSGCSEDKLMNHEVYTTIYPIEYLTDYLYGEDDKIWNSYINTNNTTNKHSLSDLIEMAKNIDVEKVQSGITSLQKALGLVNDLFTKDNKPNNNYRPRPLYRSFDD